MGEVVGFVPPDAGEKMWQCSCDSFTFNMLWTGKIRCANCGKVTDADGEASGWRSQLPDQIDLRDPVKGSTNVIDLGSSEAAIDNMLRKISARKPELITLIAIYASGACNSWTDTLEREQFEWLKRRLEQFLDDMIVYHKIDMSQPAEADTNGDQGPA